MIVAIGMPRSDNAIEQYELFLEKEQVWLRFIIEPFTVARPRRIFTGFHSFSVANYNALHAM